VRHGYPWVPTDQAHGHPRQVGPTYQKTRRLVGGPNRPSWWPTRPPENISEDSPDDLIQNDHKTWCARQDTGEFRPKQIDRYGNCCNLDLGLPVVTNQESGNRPRPLANIRRAWQPLYNHAIPKQSTPTTGRRVLLSRGPNQYKLALFSVFRVLVCSLRVLSLRFPLAEQLNHRD
jgi:hypothetical protein